MIDHDAIQFLRRIALYALSAGVLIGAWLILIKVVSDGKRRR